LPAFIVLVLVSYFLSTKVMEWQLERHGYLTVHYSRKSMFVRCCKLVCFFTFLLYPGVTTQTFLMFNCVRIGGAEYLSVDLSVRCYDSPEHQFHTGLAVAAIFVYVIGIPLVTLAVLYRNRDSIKNRPDDIAVHMKFGQLYHGFKPRYYYFEVVDMARKLLMTGGLILLGDGTPFQMVAGIIVCFGFVSVVLKTDPYDDTPEFLLQTTMSTQLFMTLVCGMLILNSSDDDESAISSILLAMFFLTLFCGIGLFILSVVSDGVMYTFCGPIILVGKYMQKLFVTKRAKGKLSSVQPAKQKVETTYIDVDGDGIDDLRVQAYDADGDGKVDVISTQALSK
jgi:hypothetical protein